MKNIWILFLGGLLFIGGCDPSDPEPENVEEVINQVTLTFTPTSGGSDIIVTATDPDGDGPQDIVVGTITLENNFEYTLNLGFENTLENPAENITEEVEEEGAEHLILFGWTGDVFSDPTNSDIATNRSDINYNDTDDNGEPIGLSTTWTTVSGTETGTFRVVLKHQPDGIKTSESGINDGSTDVDITFDIEVGK